LVFLEAIFCTDGPGCRSKPQPNRRITDSLRRTLSNYPARNVIPSGISILEIPGDQTASFAAFTYPMFRGMVASPPAREMIYNGATDETGSPVGLTFGMGGPNGEYEMVSVYVGALYRQMGIGSAMVNALHDAFEQRGYRTGVHIFTLDADDQSYGEFLIGCGYSKPNIRQLVCKTTVELAESTPWLRDAPVP